MPFGQGNNDSRGLRGGKGRGGGGYHKPPQDNRFRGNSTTSDGSGRSEYKGPVAPTYVNPKWNRQEQLAFLQKERGSAKYNVLLPFRRSKAFCPRFYQQALYTPSLILVQELFALAEAACSLPSTDEDESTASGSTAASKEGPNQVKESSISPPTKKTKKKVALLSSSPESTGSNSRVREKVDKGKAPVDGRYKPVVKKAPKSPRVVRRLQLSDSGSDKEDSPKILKVVVPEEKASPPSEVEVDYSEVKCPTTDQMVKLARLTHFIPTIDQLLERAGSFGKIFEGGNPADCLATDILNIDAIHGMTNVIFQDRRLLWEQRASVVFFEQGILTQLFEKQKEPEEIISLIDFRHITDAITEKEALEILRGNNQTKQQRVTELESSGMPAYITSVGWMGYSNEKIERLTKEALAGGWTSFKMKVGISLENDHERAKFIRQLIGPDKNLMMDANQKWDVSEAISWMTSLAEFNPLWIEEPTSPDDVLGHAEIGKALKSAKIGIATGEHCQNRVMFKQFLKSGAMDFCQIDGCRVGGVNENIAIMLMAAKYKVPVCPHAGGVGLCELVTHLAAFNYACIAPTWKNTMIEFADHLHEHFVDPAVAKNGRYSVPMKAGYAEMKTKSRDDHVYPEGQVWQKLFSQGKFTPPS